MSVRFHAVIRDIHAIECLLRKSNGCQIKTLYVSQTPRVSKTHRFDVWAHAIKTVPDAAAISLEKPPARIELA